MSGFIGEIETSFFRQVEEMSAWVHKELVPVRNEVEKAVAAVAQVIVDRAMEKSWVHKSGIGIVESVVGLVNRIQVERQLVALCKTIFRVKIVGMSIMAASHPAFGTLAAIGLTGHALYRAIRAAEEASVAGKTADNALEDAFEAFLFKGLLNPIDYAVDKTVEFLNEAASDLQSTKQLFVTLGQCI